MARNNRRQNRNPAGGGMPREMPILPGGAGLIQGGGMPGGQEAGMPQEMPILPGGASLTQGGGAGNQGALRAGSAPAAAGQGDIRGRGAPAGQPVPFRGQQAEERQIPDGSAVRSGDAEEAYRQGQRMGAESMLRDAGLTFGGNELEKPAGITREKLQEADRTLMEYKAGKASVERRIIQAQDWWKMKNWAEIEASRGTRGSTTKKSATGWLWNCIVGKHADAIDSYPEPVILPRMQDDKEEANRLSKIIPVVLDINGFEQTYNDAMWQKMQEGTGVYGIFWDNTKLNGMGDIAIRKVNILNLYWEPGISDIEDSRNVFYVSFEEKDDLQARYPQLDGKLNTSKIFIEKYKTDDSIDLSSKAAVIDWYYKKFENGRTVLHYCKYVNETCLYSSEEEGLAEGYYTDGEYPFVLDSLFPVEGSPAGYGYIDVAHDTQMDIDILNQAMVLNAAMRSTPRYFGRKDGGINEQEFMDWSKPIVHVSGGLGEDALRTVEVQQMGADAHNMLQQKIDEIKFITGNTDVNNGGVPSGVTAASAIAALKEDSGRSSKDSTKNAYRAYARLIRKTIERIRQFYDIPRQFRILGQDGQEEFVSYSNASLQMQPMPTLLQQDPVYRLPMFDIEIRAQRENAYTKMSQNELALQFWSNGLLNPQMTDQALIVLDMMDFRGKEELRKKIQAQGTMMDMLQKVAQLAMMLAQKYDPAMAEQLGMMLQGLAAETGMAVPAAGAATPQKSLAPDDATEAPHDPRENALVRRAGERAANASRPN